MCRFPVGWSFVDYFVSFVIRGRQSQIRSSVPVLSYVCTENLEGRWNAFDRSCPSGRRDGIGTHARPPRPGTTTTPCRTGLLLVPVRPSVRPSVIWSGPGRERHNGVSATTPASSSASSPVQSSPVQSSPVQSSPVSLVNANRSKQET
jgi:hypothetical protein